MQAVGLNWRPSRLGMVEFPKWLYDCVNGSSAAKQARKGSKGRDIMQVDQVVMVARTRVPLMYLAVIRKCWRYARGTIEHSHTLSTRHSSRSQGSPAFSAEKAIESKSEKEITEDACNRLVNPTTNSTNTTTDGNLLVPYPTPSGHICAASRCDPLLLWFRPFYPVPSGCFSAFHSHPWPTVNLRRAGQLITSFLQASPLITTLAGISFLSGTLPSRTSSSRYPKAYPGQSRAVRSIFSSWYRLPSQ